MSVVIHPLQEVQFAHVPGHQQDVGGIRGIPTNKKLLGSWMATGWAQKMVYKPLQNPYEYYSWLVVWLTFFIFPYVGNNHPK